MNTIAYTGSFTALDEAGRRYELKTYVERIDVSTLDSEYRETIDGMKSIRTSSGEPVNYIEKGRYQLVSTGKELRSTDPNCP